MASPRGVSYDVPVISAAYARRFLDFMESRGVGSRALLDGSQLSEQMLGQPERFLSINQLHRLFDEAQSAIQDERMPFQFGQRLDLEAHGLLGFAFIRHEGYQELVSRIVQYLRVCLPIMDMEVSRRGSALSIRLVDNWSLGEQRSFISRIYMGSIHTLASLACDHLEFELDSGTALPIDDWEAISPGTRFRFGAEQSRAILPLPSGPIRSDAGGMASVMAESPLDDEPTQGRVVDLVGQVREHIMTNLGRECTLDRAAQSLKMSARALRHHLKLAGVSFRSMRNDIRFHYATRYLTETSVPLEVIANKLGFSDQASFTRAYRSWKGRTPGEVRRHGE
ncbi:AraC-like DNA-binding protein [Tamilnaduibacter salinus]|uniref:AraC-like DNA-binding protein n=1 Tax=Tamilnaduibacter salinus TaxID=1484056 RepID=A0A2U1D047_9GAMM|nr:AraC family transcriptional regulator [Tamilnaduibacter salinus]PVY78415.1 AraC-like DNA-binding protein [Tamilnaduibacter salinus]